MFLRILALFLIVAGAVFTFGAKTIAEKYGLDKNTKVEHENEFDEEELNNYKKQKAILKVKIIGMFICLPGIVMVMILFK